MNKLVEQFGVDGRTPVFLDTSPHVLTNVVKRYLINLAEPLLTYELFMPFIEAAEATDPDGNLMWNLLNRLPARHIARILRLRRQLLVERIFVGHEAPTAMEGGVRRAVRRVLILFILECSLVRSVARLCPFNRVR